MADEEINAGKVIIFPPKTTVGLCPPVPFFSPGLAFKCRRTYKKIGQANCAPFVSFLSIWEAAAYARTGSASVKLPLKMHN